MSKMTFQVGAAPATPSSGFSVMYFKTDGLPYSKNDAGVESEIVADLPVTTKGDLFTFSTFEDRLPVGTNGQILFADSSQSVGLKWNSPGYLNLGLGSAASLAFDTDGSLSSNSDARIATQKAVKTYIDLAVTGLLDFKGSTDASGNPNYPAALKGDAYVINVAGKIGGASGISVDVGDFYVANADNAGGSQAAVGSSWFILEHNLIGALLSSNNLSDVSNVATARTNLGLGTAAVQNIAFFLQTANNLSDLPSASTARINLGLGNASTLAFDIDGTLAANSDARIATQKAVKTYVDLSVTGLLDFKGATDASTNPNYPAALKGDAYVISVAGKIGGASGLSVDVGDVYVASADNAGGSQASVGTSWFILEHNLVGALLAANNLSDLASASTARTNLGLGTMAVVNSPAPVGNGGTGTSTSFTAGSVVFAGASGVYSQDNSKLFWDDTNFYLGIGTASPSAGLHILNGTAANKLLLLKMAASQSGKVIEVQNSAGTILAQMDNQGFLGLAGASDPSVALIVSATNAIRYGTTSFTQLVSGGTNSQINVNAGANTYLAMGHATPFHGSIGTTTLFAKLGILPSATTQIGLAVRNIASQSANLVEFQDSAGTAMIFVDQAGNMQFKVAGKGIAIREGSNARMGVATLVAGTVTVTNTVPSASSRIFLSHATTGGVIGTLTYTISAGVSFTINSSVATDTSTVNWLIIDPS